jgi:hypothetical protein
MMPAPWRCRNNLDAGLPYFRPVARYDSHRVSAVRAAKGGNVSVALELRTMFRKRKKQDIIVPEPAETTPVEQIAFESLPFIDNETLDDFLADQDSVELLPVDPSDYRREIQRMIVSAFLHEASTQAKHVEAV